MQAFITLIFIGAIVGLGLMVGKGTPTLSASPSPATANSSEEIPTNETPVAQGGAPSGQLFYLTDNDDQLEIRTVDILTKSDKLIYSDKGRSDGMKLVSKVTRSGDSILLVIGPGSDNRGKLVALKTDGSGKTSPLLGDFEAAAGPVISPDQTKFATTRFVNTEAFFGFTLSIYDIDGKNRKDLSNDAEGLSSPSFSPDGKQLAIIKGSNTKTNEIAVFDTTSQKMTRLYHKENQTIHDIDWSPVGLIAFTAGPTSNLKARESYIFDPKTNEVVQITKSATAERSTTVAPDASGVATIQVVANDYTPNEPGKLVVTQMNGENLVTVGRAIELLGWVK